MGSRKVLFSKIPKQLLLYSTFGITRQGVRVNLSNQKLESGKVMKVGEDACFVALPTNCHQVFGVADGLNNHKCSASFSKKLMEHCFTFVKENLVTDLSSAVKILNRGYEELIFSHPKPIGCSMACILSVNHSSGILEAAHLGECGFLVIRDGVLCRSTEKCHHENYPFALLTNAPCGFIDYYIHDAYSVSPLESEVVKVPITIGDTILVATNGLLKNMDDSELVENIKAGMMEFNHKAIETTVTKIVEEAYRRSHDEKLSTPITNKPSRAYDKHDKASDIIAILGAIVRNDEKL